MAPDANDLHRAGQLDDPEATAEPWPPPDDGGYLDGLAADGAPSPGPGAGRTVIEGTEPEAPSRAAGLAAGRLSAVLPTALARMRARAKGDERPIPLPSEWTATAAELHGGLWPGCYVLVGGTGAGKSQWAFQASYHASVNEKIPVLYVGLELDELGVVARLAGLASTDKARGYPDAVRWSALYLGDWYGVDRIDRRPELAEALAAAPFYMVTGDARGTGRGWSYAELAPSVRALREAHPEHAGPVLVVVDFLQLVTGPAVNGRRPELREIIGQAAYHARMVARELNAVVLLLSATARSAYPLFQGKGAGGEKGEALGFGDRARFVGTGKESGEVEYAADAVLALAREPWPTGATPSPVWLAVAKMRAGPAAGGTGWVRYTFNGTTFAEHPPHRTDPPPPKPKAPKAPTDDLA